MEKEVRKEVTFRGDPLFQVMATPQLNQKVFFLNENALNEIKSYSEDIDLFNVPDLVLSKLLEKQANIKFLLALERCGETESHLPETLIAYAQTGEDEYKLEGVFSKRKEYIAPETGEEVKLNYTYSNKKMKVKKLNNK